MSDDIFKQFSRHFQSYYCCLLTSHYNYSLFVSQYSETFPMDASNIDERFLPFPKEMNIEHYLLLIKLDNEQMFSVGQ